MSTTVCPQCGGVAQKGGYETLYAPPILVPPKNRESE